MKKKKDNRKKLLIIIVLVIVILIVLLIALVKSKKTNGNESFRQIDYEAEQKRIEEYFSDKVIPQGIYDFTMEYGGNINRNDMYQSLYAITRYLPDLCSSLKDNKSSDFYAKNKSQIETCLGIETEEEFDKLVKHLENTDLSDSVLEYCAYRKGSLTKSGDGWYFYMDFKYSDYSSIVFYMRVPDSPNGQKSVLKILAP